MLLADELKQYILKKQIISIIYGDTDNYHQIRPLKLITANNGKCYLLAININLSEERRYLINRIRRIEVTSLQFSQSKDITLDNKYFKNVREVNYIDEIRNRIELKEINNEILNYYIKALKLEGLMDVNINLKDNKELFYLNGNDCISAILSEDYKIILSDENEKVMEQIIKVIEKEPGNSIYLGYPFIIMGNSLIPLIFQKIIYNIDKKEVYVEKESTILNYKLFSKDFEFDEEDIEDIKNNILSGNINNLIESNILSSLIIGNGINLVKDKGFVFIENEQNQIMGLLTELKKIETENKKNKLINSFLNYEINSEKVNSVNHIFNVVEINDSQIEAINKSDNSLEIIQGPPGTGKTQTIVNLVANYVINNKKVLVASQNNKAVDNVYEKIKKEDINIGALRLGNIDIRNKSFDDMIENVDLKRKELDLYEKRLEDIDEYKSFSVNLEMKINNSKKLQKDIEFINSKINETNILIKESLELDKNINILNENLVKIGLNDKKDFYKDNISKLNDNIALMNKVSCLCEEFENKRNKTIWRALSKLRFNYDKFRIKQILKSLKDIDLNLYGNMNFDIILDLKDCADGNVMLMEYSLLKNKYINILTKIKELKNEKFEERLKGEKENKKINDREIIDIKQKKSLYEFIKYDVDIINLLKSNDSSILKKDLELFKNLLNIYPVILTTNLSAFSSIPFDEIFDVVIIDESSQCNIPSILPLIARAKSLILVGDDKQLSPVITMSESENEKLINKFKIDNKYSFKDNSIFDFYNNSINDGEHKVLLNEHFRCDPRIINISNELFYESKLTICTTEKQGKFFGVKYSNIKGEITRGIGGKSLSNLEEIKEIKRFLQKNRDYLINKNIGIITPYKAQKIKIEEMIKTLEGFEDKIIVGTVHTFQGDEKDIIIFSSVLTKGIEEKNLKWINKERNIINVAITRAKELFYVVGDLDYLANSKGLLKDFANYIKKYSDLEEISVIVEEKEYSIYELLSKHKISFLDNNNEEIKSIMNKGEKILFDILKKVIKLELNQFEIGIKIRLGDVFNISPERIDSKLFYYGLSSHFDFIIFERENNLKPIMAIELDGNTHRNDKRSIDNDEKKNKLCEIYKFPIVRISSREKISEEKIADIIKGFI